MAFSQLPYANLDDAKAQLQIASSDTSSDVFLTNAIQYVQGFIDRYTGRTFGAGDPGDSPFTEYSNSDNIGIITTSLSGSILTLTLMGAGPWVVGQNVSVFNTANPLWNGVWAVTAVPGFAQISVDISVSKGTLSPSDQVAYTNMPAPNFAGYVGNYVQNYRYITQEQYDGFAGKTIYLRNADIRSVDTLYVGLRNIAQPVLLDHTQYVWQNSGRLILGGSYFNSANSGMYDPSQDSSFYGTVASVYQTISVSYYCGYVGVPADIQMAAYDMITTLFILRKSLGVVQERLGDWEVRYDIMLRKQLAQQPDSFGNINARARIKV